MAKHSGDMAIVWSRITLDSVVREMEVSNPFAVTEVFQHDGTDWRLHALSFSSVCPTHELERRTD